VATLIRRAGDVAADKLWFHKLKGSQWFGDVIPPTLVARANELSRERQGVSGEDSVYK
jgi:hypothetical protein